MVETTCDLLITIQILDDIKITKKNRLQKKFLFCFLFIINYMEGIDISKMMYCPY